jgi:hypothetical protein
MKNTVNLLLAAIALGAASSYTNAQTAVPHRQKGPTHAVEHGQQVRPQHRPLPLIGALDVNRDRVIDAAELAKAPAQLKTLDVNGDGILSTEEVGPGIGGVLEHRHGGPARGSAPAHRAESAPAEGDQEGMAPPPPPPPPHVPSAPFMTALDINQDGVIDADEIANSAAALKTLDKNANGQLDPEEYRPEVPHRPVAPRHSPHRSPLPSAE